MYIREEIHIPSGMILEASGKIGRHGCLLEKEKKLFVEKWGWNGKDGDGLDILFIIDVYTTLLLTADCSLLLLLLDHDSLPPHATPNTHLCTPTTSLHHYHHHHLASQPASHWFVTWVVEIDSRKTVGLAGWQHHTAKSAKSDCGAPLLLLLCVISHKHKKSNHTKMLGCEMDPFHASLPPSLPHSSCGDISSMISAAKNKNLVSHEKRLVCISCPTI